MTECWLLLELQINLVEYAVIKKKYFSAIKPNLNTHQYCKSDSLDKYLKNVF